VSSRDKPGTIPEGFKRGSNDAVTDLTLLAGVTLRF
jgi:hypothetical protein